jgi:hypothetical protein
MLHHLTEAFQLGEEASPSARYWRLWALVRNGEFAAAIGFCDEMVAPALAASEQGNKPPQKLLAELLILKAIAGAVLTSLRIRLPTPARFPAVQQDARPGCAWSCTEDQPEIRAGVANARYGQGRGRPRSLLAPVGKGLCSASAKPLTAA